MICSGYKEVICHNVGLLMAVRIFMLNFIWVFLHFFYIDYVFCCIFISCFIGSFFTFFLDILFEAIDFVLRRFPQKKKFDVAKSFNSQNNALYILFVKNVFQCNRNFCISIVLFLTKHLWWKCYVTSLLFIFDFLKFYTKLNQIENEVERNTNEIIMLS